MYSEPTGVKEVKIGLIQVHPKERSIVFDIGDDWIEVSYEEALTIGTGAVASQILSAIGIDEAEINVWLEDCNVDGLQELTMEQVIQDFFYRRIKCREHNLDPLDNWC